MSKSQTANGTVQAALRARVPLIWIVSPEETRIEPYLFEGGAAVNPPYETRFWDIAQGFTSLDGTVIMRGRGERDPDDALDAIRENQSRVVWVMRDLAPWITAPTGMFTQRKLRNLAAWLPKQPSPVAQSLIILSTSSDIPPELVNSVTVIDWPLPDREEISALLDAAVAPILDSATIPEAVREAVRTSTANGTRDAAIDAAVGLSGEEAQTCFARSLVQHRRIDAAAIAQEKKRLITRAGMEWIDPPATGMAAVGGLDVWRRWALSRRVAYSPQARAYGLPTPKGVLLIGVPGCGKSHSAKALGGAWNVPVIRLDLGAQKSKFVGESEGNLRNALSRVEAIGPCILWIDEIEKALAGATGEAGDGGVSADALGAILTWMQDRQGEAFVIATANDAQKLPPELLRKGRFDEVWWVDLPNREERAAIAAATLRGYGRDPDGIGIDLQAVADATDTFTGAEIAALVPDALFAAFNEDAREISTDDLLRAAKTVVPLARTADDKIKRLREFWAGRARPATSTPVKPTAYEASKPFRALDL